MSVQETLVFINLLRSVSRVAKSRNYSREDILVTLETIANNYEVSIEKEIEEAETQSERAMM